MILENYDEDCNEEDTIVGILYLEEMHMYELPYEKSKPEIFPQCL